MKTTEQIGYEVDSWISEEELPVPGCLKVLKAVNPLYDCITHPVTGELIFAPMDEDEIQEYNEHRYWFLTKDYHLIMSLPKPEDDDFKIPIELDGDETLSFAFSSMDFQRANPFNKYHNGIHELAFAR